MKTLSMSRSYERDVAPDRRDHGQPSLATVSRNTVNASLIADFAFTVHELIALCATGVSEGIVPTVAAAAGLTDAVAGVKAIHASLPPERVGRDTHERLQAYALVLGT
jgi:hypothetical protein